MKDFSVPMVPGPTCDFPNCEKPMAMGISGNPEGDPYPSQWCEEHLQYVGEQLKKDPNWIRKFQKGEIEGLPKDERGYKVYAW